MITQDKLASDVRLNDIEHLKEQFGYNHWKVMKHNLIFKCLSKAWDQNRKTIHEVSLHSRSAFGLAIIPAYL